MIWPGKPEYLKTSRNRTQALKYGYDDPENIRRHTRDYYASVEQMDAAVGRVLDELERLRSARQHVDHLHGRQRLDAGRARNDQQGAAVRRIDASPDGDCRAADATARLAMTWC